MVTTTGTRILSSEINQEHVGLDRTLSEPETTE